MPSDWWRTVFYLIPLVTIYTVVLGTMMVFATTFLVITLLVDIAYTFVDPRIRY